MIAKRFEKQPRSGRSRSGRQNRDLAVALGVVTGLALLVAGAVLLYGRSGSEPEELAVRGSVIQGASLPSLAADSQLEQDQRLSASRMRQPMGDQSAEDRDSAARSSDQAADGLPPAPPQDSADDENNPRKLLRKVRKQVKAGQSVAALETSRQIASLVESESDRAKIEDKISQAEAAAGAGQMIDFTSLIELIEQTIAPNSWTTVGGAGTVTSFAGGVYVDTSGLVRPRANQKDSTELSRVRQEARGSSGLGDGNEKSGLRKISLPRLEKEVAGRLARGEPLTDEMRFLAGLQEVRYVLVYPEEHDIVVVGPADEWVTDEFGRTVGRTNGRPVLHLQDLVVVLRACYSESENAGLFGCGIYPRQERLQRTQEFLARSAAAGPIEPTERDRWLVDLRDQLGPQDIEVFGIQPGSRVAHVLVEADYRMKLVGIGLEQAAVAGIPSYFDLIGQPDDARLSRPIDTLRWWFTLNYDAIVTSEQHDAFELRGGRVQVLSENELLTATGQRVHTGQSDPINAQFARNFTEHFPALAERDVNYAELAGIFDLAVAAGLLRGHELPKLAGWPMSTFLDPDEFVVSLNPPPRTVETVMNHRVYRGRHIMAAISGGVHVNPWKVVSQDHLQVDSSGTLKQLRSGAASAQKEASHWWWD